MTSKFKHLVKKQEHFQQKTFLVNYQCINFIISFKSSAFISLLRTSLTPNKIISASDSFHPPKINDNSVLVYHS